MKYTEAMVAWNDLKDTDDTRYQGKIVVVPWPDRRNLAEPYSNTVGACFSDLHELDAVQLRARLVIDFHTIVVRDRLDPQEVHNAFLAIDEYRYFIAPDIQGAEYPPEED